MIKHRMTKVYTGVYKYIHCHMSGYQVCRRHKKVLLCSLTGYFRGLDVTRLCVMVVCEPLHLCAVPVCSHRQMDLSHIHLIELLFSIGCGFTVALHNTPSSGNFRGSSQKSFPFFFFTAKRKLTGAWNPV